MTIAALIESSSTVPGGVWFAVVSIAAGAYGLWRHGTVPRDLHPIDRVEDEPLPDLSPSGASTR